MSVRISWAPSSHPYIASYDIYKGTSSSGPFTFLVNVAHSLAGANYDPVAGFFFYDDIAGTLANWYTLTSIDQSANRSVASAPFEPASLIPAFTNTVKVDHNYGSPGALRYQTAAGAPIEQALIRVYLKANYDQGETDQPLAVTATNAAGNWVTSVNLTTGYTYTIVFAREGLYGPNRVDVVV